MYARVPFGFWIQDVLDLGRNPYDKIGHFAQGLVPMLLAREVLLRKGYATGTRVSPSWPSALRWPSAPGTN